jgi:hypothetical protein
MSAHLEKVAADVVDDLQRVFEEPPLGTRVVSLADYRKIDRVFYQARTAELEELGFRVLRDLDASHLLHPKAPPAPIRVLLHEDGAVTAAIYHAIPKHPGLLLKLLMRLFRQWQEARVVDLVTYVGDEIVETTDAGNAAFIATPPFLRREVLEPGGSVASMLAVHRRAVEDAERRIGQTRRRFDGLETLMAAREDGRVRVRHWRHEVGGLLPEELDRLLAPHGKTGHTLRPFLERELERRGLRARTPTDGGGVEPNHS